MPLIEISVPAVLEGEPTAAAAGDAHAGLLRRMDGHAVSDLRLTQLLEDGDAASSRLLDAGLSGGQPVLEFDLATRSLRCVMRLRSRRALVETELRQLTEAVTAQLLDGFGSQPIAIDGQADAWIAIESGPIAVRVARQTGDIARGWLERLGHRLPGRSPIFTALSQGRLDEVGRLARASRRHLDARDEWDCTPLMLAIRDGHTALALDLLALGASATHRSAANGSQPLHFAAMVGDVAVGRALLMAGADIDAPKRDPERHHAGSTPLMWAASRRHPDFVRLLVDSGASIDLRDVDGSTAAHNAALSHDPDYATLELLLNAGADVTIPNQHGRTVVDEARAQARNNKTALRDLLARHRPQWRLEDD